MKGKYLITTDNYFFAPDGKQYRAVWGDVKVINDKESLGINTNARSANWYAAIGSEENHVIVAGCQIHYSVKCENKPNTDSITDYTIDGGVKREYQTTPPIYIAE